jgi:hypothetical protein
LQIRPPFEGLQLRSDLADLGRPIDDPFGQVIDMLLESAIDGTSYECERSAISTYVDEVFGGLTPDELYFYKILRDYYAVGTWALYLVYYDTFQGSPPYGDFYPNKQQGQEYEKRLKDLHRFWDSSPEDIALSSFNALRFADDTLMVPFFQWAYVINGQPIDTELATAVVNYVQAVFEFYPAIGYDFPLWSLNAFAFIFGKNGIAMGDGLAMFLESAGIDDSGPDYVLFHEFAHQVQFEIGVNFVDTPEGTRYTELMADALASYYGHHAHGATFQTKRIKDVVEAAYGVGDCQFSSPGHHGTPNQRAKAVDFATNLVDTAKNKGHKLSASGFIELFNAAYEDIIAPDV